MNEIERNDLQKRARRYFNEHVGVCDKWEHGLPDKIWKEDETLCIRYKDGKYWHYMETEHGLEWW